MANTKSAQKQARQNELKRKRNLSRSTALKTAVKKVLTSIEKSDSLETVQGLLKEAEAKIARAKGKGLIHKNAARRKISRLAKKISAVQKEARTSAKK